MIDLIQLIQHNLQAAHLAVQAHNEPVSFSIIPLIVAGIGAKLLGGYLKGRAKKKQAKALNAANQEYNTKASAAFDVDENRRVERLNAAQGLLQRTQPFLRSGPNAAGGTGPDYTFDPAVLQRLQQKKAYVPGRETLVDNAAGLGSQMYGELSSGVGDALLGGWASGILKKNPSETAAAPVAGPPISGMSDEALAEYIRNRPGSLGRPR